MGLVTWRALLVEAQQRLIDAGLESPEIEARRLVEEASGHQGVALLVALDDVATTPGAVSLDGMVARRVAGEPLQYVLGHWPFRALDLLVDRRVLIPRPETEQVCGWAIAELDRVTAHLDRVTAHPDRSGVDLGGHGRPDQPQNEAWAGVADLGAGSGAIGLSIATERPGTEVWAVERSADAAEACRANLARLGRAVERVHLVEGSWFEPLPPSLRGRLAVVASNPPYVAEADELPALVADWEPSAALFPGPTGLEAIEVLTAEAPRWLLAAGALVLEIGETQGGAALRFALAAGFAEADIRQDHNGRDRALVARR